MKALPIFALVSIVAAQAPTTIVNVAETGNKATIQFAENSESGYKALEFDTPSGHVHLGLRNPVNCLPKKRGVFAHEISGMQMTSSQCLFIGKYKKNGTAHTLLLLTGGGGITYPDAPENTVIIGFDAKGKPYKVLELDAFEPTALVDSSTGPQIEGWPDSHEGFCGHDPAPNVATYDPAAVYVIDTTGHAQWNGAETEAYNRAHYVWAGPRPSEKIKVFEKFPGHDGPFIPSAKEAELLMHKYCNSGGE